MAKYSFQEIMHHWKRMCNADKGTVYSSVCTRCPMVEQISACHAICDKNNDDVNWDKVYEIVIGWAKENPEPVYPTWGEWLESIGVAQVGSGMLSIHPAIAEQPIPADIAQKLGIEPKDG